MKTIYKITLYPALALLLGSCADLEMPADGRASYNDIFGQYERTSQYATSCMAYVVQPGLSIDGSPLASVCDEAHDADDYADGNISNYYKGAMSPLYNPIGDCWAHYYTGIRRCNTFLLYINDPEYCADTFREEEKQGWIAMVRVARAYYYLQLAKRYGPIPLLTIPYSTGHDYSTDRRASFEEIADFVISECQRALSTPEPTGTFGFRWNINDNERGKLTRGFAYAVMSEAALFAASPLNNNGGASKYTWDVATEITKEALDQCLNHGYELFTTAPAKTVAYSAYDYYCFTQSDPSRSVDKETIYESTAQMNVWMYCGLPTTAGQIRAGACPSQELVDCYETTDGQPVLNLEQPYLDSDHLKPNYNRDNTIYNTSDPYANRDPRFYGSIYYNGALRYLDGRKDLVETYVGGSSGISDDVNDRRHTRTGYYMRKFNNFRSGIDLAGDGYMAVYRLAELYLNFAEAAYHSAGPDVLVQSSVKGQALSARGALDAIRARVGMPALPRGLSKEQFELRYRNERRVELAFEEKRFFDVRRWKILDQTDGFVTGMKIDVNYAGQYTYTRFKLMERLTNSDKYLLFPINQDDVTKMNDYTGENWQNPGW